MQAFLWSSWLVALATATSTPPPPPLPPPSKQHAPLEVMGRQGFSYSPTTRPATAAILVLHGSAADARSMFDLGFEALAEMRGFHVVYPEMVVPRSPQWGYEDDLGYFHALAERVRGPGFGVPADKVFICGHSSGGSMATFLQNQLDDFAAAGAVEAAVGRPELWNMSKRGHRTMVVWNHADDVLREYAPDKNETEYYNLTVATLRRNSRMVPDHVEVLPTGNTVQEAELRVFEADALSPELRVVSWASRPGRHTWALPSWTHTLDATAMLVNFFLGSGELPVSLV